MHPRSEERRTHRRIKPPYPLFVDCPLPKKVRDISVGGAYVEDTDPLPTGQKLHLLFKQEKARPVALRGVIRRAELRRGMGVEFVDTPPERSNHLRRLLNMTTQGIARAGAPAESAEAASEESASATSAETAAASAGGADAASVGANFESDLGEVPSFIDDGYRPPPPPEAEEETEEPLSTPKTNPLFFYAILIVSFISIFALGLAFFHYRGQAESVPATTAPPPTADTPTPTAETSPPESPAATPPPQAVVSKLEAQPTTTAEASAAIPESPAAAPSNQEGFVVQVGAYEERSKSEALARKVSAFYQGSVVVAPAQVRGKTYYRVQIPVGTREEANALAVRFAKEQKIKAWVRRLP